MSLLYTKYVLQPIELFFQAKYNQDIETTQVPNNRWVDKEIIVNMHNGIL